MLTLVIALIMKQSTIAGLDLGLATGLIIATLLFAASASVTAWIYETSNPELSAGCKVEAKKCFKLAFFVFFLGGFAMILVYGYILLRMAIKFFSWLNK